MIVNANYILVCTFFLLINLNFQILCFEQERQVSRWANDIGNDLWNLGNTITRYTELRGRYGFLNAQVIRKDPQSLLNEIVEDIVRMMDRKMDAVTCIIRQAENASQTFQRKNYSEYQYYSSKEPPRMETPVNYSLVYLPMELNNDKHFYNLPVNTYHGSVHVPWNIYFNHTEPSYAIQWSEELDDVFMQNYNSDPSLFWQYFGSRTGVMRHYPAQKFDQERVDTFDCRIRPWYIEASTCTKDVVILIDTSGSMEGIGKLIAASTLFSILDTFSNNDYINVLNYSEGVNYTIPCFKEKLVQATEENIIFFKNAAKFMASGKTDLSLALREAYKLLNKYSEMRGCTETNRTCNQAIMIITDTVSKNFSDIIMEYTNMSVRIFTYLTTKEIDNLEAILWMTCNNRGYYAQVESLEQITSSVLEYINVIARPLVLQATDHPVSWTHAYMDETFKKTSHISKNYRLLTSVAAPAFDVNKNNNTDKVAAKLLGVAGTDVPIEYIEQLTYPYKIGVNGYAFIVSNNGYLLMHPNLKPVYNDILTKNYNSIDLAEVEQFDNDLPPRQIDDELHKLRLGLVNGDRGSILNVSINYHYDDMRRVTKQNYDYYFAPLNNTPFSIGIALPTRYGNYSLEVGDEISKNQHTGKSITSFFKGNNWKIHPNWVYCRHHYLENHEFETPEKELLYFLGKMYDSDFIWEKQYVSDNETLEDVTCGRTTHEDDDYYCDKQLVQRLIFDAENTEEIFNGPWEYKLNEKSLFTRYNATLRFVATMSGLTRWEYLLQEVENALKQEFGDYHSRTIDETWYKSAVIQNQYDSDSFVYSVSSLDADDIEDLSITGSFAIFPNEAGHVAPGSVVGFQFSHSRFRERFINVTSKVSPECPDCASCNNKLECYIIDSSGYIITSEKREYTGRFFGEIEGDIMHSLLTQKIFNKVTVYDYQALCMRETDEEEEGYIYEPCDKRIDLFVLQQHLLMHDNYPIKIPANRWYYVKKIPFSNLLFIAINVTMTKNHRIRYTSEPQTIDYKNGLVYPCNKLHLNDLPRRSLRGCYNAHPKEKEIRDCGKGSKLKINHLLLFIIFKSLYFISF